MNLRFFGPAMLLAASLCILPACGGGGGGGGAVTPPGPTPFSLTFQSIAASATNITRNPVIYFKFNRAANVATLTNMTFFLTDGAATINATIDWDGTFNLATLTPTAPLAGNVVHTMNLTAGIQDSGAVALSPVMFSFTTGNFSDITRPAFGGLTGATASGIASVDLTWAAATDADPTIVYDVFHFTATGTFDYSTPAVASVSGTAVTVGTLASRTPYFFVVRARDTSGNFDLGTTEDTATTLTSFANDCYPIVQSDCRSCHTSGEGKTMVPDMDYTSAVATRASWVNVTPVCPTAIMTKRVDPGVLGNSFMYNKISQVVPECGVRMPKDNPPLSVAEQDRFADWITEGALNN